MTKKKTISKIEQELLEALRSKDVGVRREAAVNPSATPEVLLLLALRDENWKVRFNAAKHPNATPEVLVIARSKIRREILPVLKSINPSIHVTMRRIFSVE